MSDKIAVAIDLHGKSYNCCQAVLAAFSEQYDMPRETALRVAGAMGGGVRCGEICGAVSGAAMVIGLKYGHHTDGDVQTKAACHAKVEAFIAAFREANGHVTCRGLLGDDISLPGVRERLAAANILKMMCPKFIQSAVQILQQQGY